MKFFDLFCGIGGFRVGLERNGHECIGSCEINEQARATYAKNFGHEPEYTDATKINPRELPDFDILAAGFPCQAFSIAGRQGGFNDDRGNLFFEIARIAREKKPRYLFLENVRNLLSHYDKDDPRQQKGDTFKTILRTLDDMGYDAEWFCVNSAMHVPQNRERIFIIGHLRGQRTERIFPIGTGYTEPDEPQGEAQSQG